MNPDTMLFFMKLNLRIFFPGPGLAGGTDAPVQIFDQQNDSAEKTNVAAKIGDSLKTARKAKKNNK